MSLERCYGCMQLKIAGQVCEHCGYDARMPGAVHHLPAGTILQGKYLVGRALGQGGFGITYIGWDINLDIPVAIKEYYPSGVVMRENTLSNQISVVTSDNDSQYEQNRARFLREAQTLAKLEDVPEVVLVKNFFSENNTAYIIMGYVRGITLQEHIRRRGGQLSVEETFGLLQPLMEALDRVHAIGLVHRDISPDNIMLQPNGKVRLIDFGAAHEATYGTAVKSTQAVLKYGFAPIEQYQRKANLGPWTDVYALCATIYYCMTGLQPPHATDRIMGMDEFAWQDIQGLTPGQRAALEQGVIMKYTDRIQSMKELSDKLFECLDQRPVFERRSISYPSSVGSIYATDVGDVPLIRPSDPVVYTAPVENEDYISALQLQTQNQVTLPLGWREEEQKADLRIEERIVRAAEPQPQVPEENREYVQQVRYSPVPRKSITSDLIDNPIPQYIPQAKKSMESQKPKDLQSLIDNPVPQHQPIANRPWKQFYTPEKKMESWKQSDLQNLIDHPVPQGTRSAVQNAPVTSKSAKPQYRDLQSLIDNPVPQTVSEKKKK